MLLSRMSSLEFSIWKLPGKISSKCSFLQNSQLICSLCFLLFPAEKHRHPSWHFQTQSVAKSKWLYIPSRKFWACSVVFFFCDMQTSIATGHTIWMLEPPQLTHSNYEELWYYSKLIPDDKTHLGRGLGQMTLQNNLISATCVLNTFSHN